MATQTAPQPAISPAAAVAGQATRASGALGGLQESAGARTAEAGNGQTSGSNLVVGAPRHGEGQGGLAASREHTSLRLAPPMERLPVSLAVSVPVREFRVRHLLAMAPGGVIETQWAPGDDLPLSSGDVQLAWSEFEVVDTGLAVRVTRLA